MNRRGFLSFLGAAVAGAILVLDPERLLWKPGAKFISIPSPALALSLEEFQYSYFRPLAIQIANQIDADMLKVLYNNTEAIRDINRDYRNYFTDDPRKVSSDFQIRRPWRLVHGG